MPYPNDEFYREHVEPYTEQYTYYSFDLHDFNKDYNNCKSFKRIYDLDDFIKYLEEKKDEDMFVIECHNHNTRRKIHEYCEETKTHKTKTFTHKAVDYDRDSTIVTHTGGWGNGCNKSYPHNELQWYTCDYETYTYCDNCGERMDSDGYDFRVSRRHNCMRITKVN